MWVFFVGFLGNGRNRGDKASISTTKEKTKGVLVAEVSEVDKGDAQNCISNSNFNSNSNRQQNKQEPQNKQEKVRYNQPNNLIVSCLFFVMVNNCWVVFVYTYN